MGVVPVLTLIARSNAVADTDLVTVRPTLAYGVPGCACGFTVVDATTGPSTAAYPCGEVGNVVKEPGDLGVARRKGGREGRVGYDKPLHNVVFLDGGVC